MFKKDYIERMATQIAKMIAELLGFNTQERLEYINEAFDTMFDSDTAELESLEGDDLLDYLSNDKNLQITQIELIGNLFHQRGKAQEEMDLLALAKPNFQKALTILEYVDREMDIYSMERRELIRTLSSKLI